jgi:hypothetical protein
MPKLTVRRATAEDLASFSDDRNKPTTICWCGDLDGEIIALGGFAIVRGRYYAFCDLRPEAGPYKMTLMRTARRAMNEAKARGVKFIYAQADLSEKNPVAWLRSLGFEVDPRSPHLYRWKA